MRSEGSTVNIQVRRFIQPVHVVEDCFRNEGWVTVTRGRKKKHEVTNEPKKIECVKPG